MKQSPILLVALLVGAMGPAFAEAPLWWSESMPHADHSSRHAHGGPVEIRRGVYYKNLWLREGDGPADARYLQEFAASSKMLLINVKGEVKEMQGEPVHGSYGINFAMPDEGFYNLYMVNESVTDGIRQINVAKSEALKHSCREGHDHVKGLMAPRHLDSMPLEIVRERLPDETFHTMVGFGDSVTFLVLQQGKPLSGAEVTMHTARGWRNTVRTDEHGHASFMLIRDYYPPWHEFQSRHRQDYVVNASYTVNEGGATNGNSYAATRYLATLNGSYYPSARDYRSYGYGLLLGTFALTFTGLSVYLYRRRRQRRFHEVRFDEKN